MNLNEMKRVLAGENILLTKSLGQNFLHDANQLKRIAEAAQLQPSDKVLEIGPGLGPLTRLLLGVSEVLAIEKDRRLYDYLARQFASSPHLRLLHADALRFLEKETLDWSDWKVVSNLPYSVASPILVELADAAQPPQRVVVTLQWEVARRIMASAGGADYGILTLLLQRTFEPADIFKISSGSFFPPPDVDSACLTLARRRTPLLPEALAPAYRKIVKRGFSERRKMMLKLLKHDWPAGTLQAAFTELGLPPDIRAEKVSLEQFARLATLLAPPEAASA